MAKKTKRPTLARAPAAAPSTQLRASQEKRPSAQLVKSQAKKPR